MNKTISLDTVMVGGIVAEMHGHETNSGLLQGWAVTSRFEVSEHMAKSMFLSAITDMHSKNNTYPTVMSGKMAYVVSVNEDDLVFDQINSVLVIYVYDSTYHVAVLTPPVLKCFVVEINGKKIEPVPYEIHSNYSQIGASIFCYQKKIPNYNFHSHYTISCNDILYDVDPVGWSVLTASECKARNKA